MDGHGLRLSLEDVRLSAPSNRQIPLEVVKDCSVVQSLRWTSALTEIPTEERTHLADLLQASPQQPRGPGRVDQGHHPLLAAFTHHPDVAAIGGVSVDVPNVDPERFPHPHARLVE